MRRGKVSRLFTEDVKIVRKGVKGGGGRGRVWVETGVREGNGGRGERKRRERGMEESVWGETAVGENRWKGGKGLG